MPGRHIVIQIGSTGEGQGSDRLRKGSNVQHEEATKSEAPRVAQETAESNTLGSGLNAGNIGAEIDVIKPTLPAQTHAPIAIRFRSFAHFVPFIALLILLQAIFRLCEVYTAHFPKKMSDSEGEPAATKKEPKK